MMKRTKNLVAVIRHILHSQKKRNQKYTTLYGMKIEKIKII